MNFELIAAVTGADRGASMPKARPGTGTVSAALTPTPRRWLHLFRALSPVISLIRRIFSEQNRSNSEIYGHPRHALVTLLNVSRCRRATPLLFLSLFRLLLLMLLLLLLLRLLLDFPRCIRYL